MSTDERLHGLATQPGDPELDCDVSDLTVTAVVAEGRELLVRLTGGRGGWTEAETGQWEPEVTAVATDLRAVFGEMPADLFAAFVARLERWRDQAVPMRMCAAPGRMTLLIADGGDFMPWPRRWPPPEGSAGW